MPPSDRSHRLFVVAVDDDDDDRCLIADAFDECGRELDLRLFSDGEQVLNYLRSRSSEGPQPRLPDAILLDINMPRMDGRQTLRELKQDDKLRQIPVMMLTTSAEDAEITACCRAGASGYIVKPASFADLVHELAVFTAGLSGGAS